VTRIDEHVFQFDGLRIGQVYLVDEGDRNTLIDTGIPVDFKKLQSQLSGMGKSINDIDYIVLTHCHSDHCGNAARIKEMSHATIIAHETEAAFIAGRDHIRYRKRGRSLLWSVINLLFRSRPVHVDNVVHDGDKLDIPCKLEVLHTPGHTPGSIALYHADKKILFTGDSIWNHKTLKVAQGFYNTDDEEMMESVKKYLDLDIEKICVGHGRSILENGGEQLKTLLGG